MVAPTRESIGNELFDTVIYIPAVTVPNLPASSTATQTIIIQGALPGDMFFWNWQGNVANIAIENIYCSAPNTTIWTWSNATIAAVNGTPAQPFLLEVIRVDIIPSGGLPGLASIPPDIQ